MSPSAHGFWGQCSVFPEMRRPQAGVSVSHPGEPTCRLHADWPDGFWVRKRPFLRSWGHRPYPPRLTPAAPPNRELILLQPKPAGLTGPMLTAQCTTGKSHSTACSPCSQLVRLSPQELPWSLVSPGLRYLCNISPKPSRLSKSRSLRCTYPRSLYTSPVSFCVTCNEQSPGEWPLSPLVRPRPRGTHISPPDTAGLKPKASVGTAVTECQAACLLGLHGRPTSG